MEQAFEEVDGVKEAISGYMNGHKKNPTYKEVSRDITGHTEAIKITYDPEKINFNQLLEHFWKNVDPTTKNEQFCDSGSQYRAGIYYANEKQKQKANSSLKKVKTLFKSVFTEVEKAQKFYKAEEYHQNYYKKNPIRYKYYKYGCAREQTLRKVWKNKVLSLP
jgi:peptide-methionine (S)-S-oxide reductase